jgi:hypothetical protein
MPTNPSSATLNAMRARMLLGAPSAAASRTI